MATRVPRWVLVAVLALVALFACLVWPTRYRYDHLRRNDQTYPVRIDRFTGRTEYFDGEWETDSSATRDQP